MKEVTRQKTKKRFDPNGQPSCRIYSYPILLDDSEIMAFREAIKIYAEVCQTKMEDGPKCPYWAHLQSLKKLEAQLCASINKVWGRGAANPHLV